MRELPLEDVNFDDVRERLLKEKEKFTRQEWADLLKRSGITSQYWTNVTGAKRQNPSMRFLLKISEALGKPLGFILHGKEFLQENGSQVEIITIPMIDNYTKQDGSFVFKEKLIVCSFPLKWILNICDDPWNLFCMKMEGDAMAPTIMPDGLMLLDKSRTTIIDNGIFAFNFEKLKNIQIRRLSFCADKIAIIPQSGKCCDECHTDISKINILAQVICVKNTLASYDNGKIFLLEPQNERE